MNNTPGLVLPGVSTPLSGWANLPSQSSQGNSQGTAPPLVSSQSDPIGSASEHDLRVMKRKQANRDSARKSKQKKKLESEELAQRRKLLVESHSELVTKVREAQIRVKQLQEANNSLKEQYQGLLKSAP